jgi:hypothetical protein
MGKLDAAAFHQQTIATLAAAAFGPSTRKPAEAIMAATILITGANGFIGSHATLALKSLGHRVLPLDLFPRSPDLSLLGIKTPSVMMDVTDASRFLSFCAAEKPTHIFHAAHPKRDESPAVLYFCYRAMTNILESAKQLDVRGLGGRLACRRVCLRKLLYAPNPNGHSRAEAYWLRRGGLTPSALCYFQSRNSGSSPLPKSDSSVETYRGHHEMDIHLR